MGKKRYVPRWLHSRAIVTSTDTVILDPEVFMNKTSWPFKIEHLTVFGRPTDQEADYEGHGGISPLMTGEIGISGSTDVNLVPANLGASFFRTKPMQAIGNYMTARYFHFNRPYLLPRDSGFSVECTLDLDDTGAEYGFAHQLKYGVSLFGRKVQTNQPAMFAGLYRYLNTPSGSSIVVDAADLLNNGEDDVLIDSIQFMHDTWDMGGDLMGFYWKVNPLTGITWMDNPVHISGLTPTVKETSEGLQSFAFCLNPIEPTYLYRRQRLGIKLDSSVLADQPVNMTLFGYLEVE